MRSLFTTITIMGLITSAGQVRAQIGPPGAAESADPQAVDVTARASYALPPPAAEAWEDELATLRQRLAVLEQADKKRTTAEQEKKAADAKKPTVKWSGQLQADSYWFNQGPDSRAAYGDIENGEAFRRARFGMFGDYGPTSYRIEMDFAQPGRPTFLDVWLGVDTPRFGKIKAGHFFEPFSLERMTSNRFTTFMERSSADSAFVPARNLGLGAGNVWLEDDRATWAVGVFRSDSDVFGDDIGDNFESSLTGRVTILPWYEDHGEEYLHLGFGFSARGANSELVRFRSQPEARIGAVVLGNVPAFVDTGNIPARSYELLGWEAAWIHGPLSVQSEFMLTPVQTKTNGTLYFNAFYVTACYFLTGEHRPYRKETGSFDRIQPRRDFLRYVGDPHDRCFEKGPGAWEIAVRASQLDLNDATVNGGRLTDLTIGLNWYLNPYLRVTTNYVRAWSNVAAGNHIGTDIFAMRVGYEF